MSGVEPGIDALKKSNSHVRTNINRSDIKLNRCNLCAFIYSRRMRINPCSIHVRLATQKYDGSAHMCQHTYGLNNNVNV